MSGPAGPRPYGFAVTSVRPGSIPMPVTTPEARAGLAALTAIAERLGVALSVSICLPPWGDAAAGDDRR